MTSRDAELGVADEPERPEERRLVTALFVDLVGFTTMGDERDPEEVRAVQRRYFDAVSAEAERLGGSVEKYIGDAVVAVFGMPRAHDDDAERALRAAVAIRDAVAAIGGLEVRIGVNTGEVVGGQADPRGGYVVTGDAMNVAARLQQGAEPGTILVGPVTQRLTAGDFEYAEPVSLSLKGKGTTVGAAELLGLRERSIRVRPGTVGLVGRDGELTALESALDEAIAGRGRVVAVVGEAGIGKSRLALELRHRAADRGASVVWAAARSYASEEPYFLVGRLVRALVERSRDGSLTRVLGGLEDPAAVERWRVVLGALLGERDAAEAELTPQSRQRAIADAVGAIVGATAARSPLVVVVDDLHWADPASRAIVDEVVDAIAAMPVLLVATARPTAELPWATRRHYRQLNLDSLVGSDARRLARALAGDRALAPDVAERLLDRSGGNPFFLEELVAGALDGEAARSRLPETVQEVLLARLDGLPDDARRTLQLAAVVGMEFSEELLAVLAPPGDVVASLDRLRREDVLVRRASTDVHSGWVFRHPLIQEVAYRSVLLAHRRDLHGRLARHLEAEDRDELVPAIAVHYRASDDPERARAALVRAAERAERLYATSEAATFYRDAAELTTDDAERGALLERAAFQTYLSAGAHERAVELYRAAISAYEAAGLTVRAHDARRNLSRVHWTAADTAGAERSIDEAIAGLEALPPSAELAAAYSYRSQLLMLRPRPEEGVAWAQRAIELAERLGASHVLPHAYTNLGSSRIMLGDPRGFDDVRLAIRLALELDRPDDAARGYTNLSTHGDMVPWGPHEEIDALLEEGITYAAEKLPGGTYDQAMREARAELRVVSGRWEEAERELSRLRFTSEYNALMIGSLHGLLAGYRGNGDLAPDLEATLEAAEAIRDLQMIVPRYAALLHAHRARREYADAAGLARRAAARIGELRHGRLLSFFGFEAVDVARAALRAGDTAAATALVDALAPIALRNAPDADAAPTPFETTVRRALVGSALHALADAAARTGSPTAEQLRRLAATLPEELAAADDLDAAGRPFDAARARLWAAERGLAVDAAALHEVLGRLGARDHAERARSLA